MRPELIRATELLQQQTPEAVDEALGLLQNTVYSFSMKVCGHPEDAEDTMQEVLYRSIRHLAKLQEPKALAAWLYTVTRNRCWRMRKPMRTGARTVSLDALMPDDAELARLLEDAAAGPEEDLLGAEQHSLVQRAVLKIPPQLRMVLVLHDVEDLATEQVAQVLGLQPGTVRVRLHRARLAVRKQLQALQEVESSAKAKIPRKRAKSKTNRPAECRELFANLSEYLDGRIEGESCEQMRAHIEGCPSCVVFLRDLRAAVDRCRAMEVRCDQALTARLRTLLTQEYLRLIGAPLSQNK